MKVSEVIELLSKQKPDAEVLFEWEEKPNCDCAYVGYGYCYCSYETRQEHISTIDPFQDKVIIRGNT